MELHFLFCYHESVMKQKERQAIKMILKKVIMWIAVILAGILVVSASVLNMLFSALWSFLDRFVQMIWIKKAK